MVECLECQGLEIGWQCKLYILSCNQSLVGEYSVEYQRLSIAQILGRNARRNRQYNHRHRHLCLKLHIGLDFILILNLCLLNLPVDIDSLIAQVHHLLGLRTRVNQQVVSVGIVLFCRYSYRIVTLCQICREETLLVGNSLGYNCACGRVGYLYLGTSQMRSLLGIVGILIAYIDGELTFLGRYRLDIERQRHAFAVGAVDGNIASHWHVELHLVRRSHAQDNLRAFVLGQRWHLHRCYRRNP